MDTEFRPIDRSAHELLVVDDDPVSRYTTLRVLQHAGFRVREAANGAEGMAAADSSISAMVLDVHLPDIDGFELCRRLRLREDTARLPVLHLSASYVTDDDKVRGLDAGADAYLTHPVEPAVLVATVQALVRTRIAEEAMRRSEAKFRAIYARAPGGMCLLDDAGRLLDMNPAMLAFLGRDAGVVVGRRLSEFVPPPWITRVDDFIDSRETGVDRLEFPIEDPNGRTTPIEWSLSRDIEPGVTLAVAADVSQRSALEQQRQHLLEGERVARSAAERISRMKDELIAVLSHELRAPLNAIMGWTHVLQMRGGSEPTLKGLQAIERNGHIQARMISDILDMSRLNMGKMPLSFEMIDPAEVLSSALNAMQPSIDESALRVVTDLQAPHRLLRADSSRLQQVIWNLLSNAIKFSPRGAEVRIAIRDESDGLRLTVTDQGQGISPEFLPYLFDRFTQSDAGSNRQRGGLGLGLSIVKQLVEAHGGTISAHSDGAGRGARFEVWLPTDGVQESETHGESQFDDSLVAEETEGSLHGMKLLIVDDDEDARVMLGIILSDRGASVTPAGGYDEALTLLQNLKPDAIVSDIGMPGKDGYDLIREVRRREQGGSRVPAVALTSFTRLQDEQQAIAAGFDAHCPKPLRPMKLVQALRLLTSAASRGGRGG
jgi:PAS domain S-box-containing protein